MKLRLLFFALGLGCIFYFAPLIAAGLPVAWPLFWLASPTDEPIKQTGQGQNDGASAVELAPSLAQSSSSRAGSLALLKISKAGSPAIVKAGDPLTYTIIVSNTGTTAAQKVIIADKLPDGLHFHGESYITVSGGVKPQLQVGAQQITGTVEMLQPTGRVVIVGRVRVDHHVDETTLLNRAVVTATNNSNSNNWATVTTTLLTATPTAPPPATATPTATPTSPAAITTTPTLVSTPSATPTTLPDLADLQLKKTAAHDPVIGGSLITYTIQVSNAGPGPARNVVLRDLLPKALFFEGNSSLMVLLGQSPQLQLSRTELTATLSTLDVGGLLTITAPVRTPPTVINQMLINRATVTADTPDPQPANNNAGAPIVLFPPTLLERKNYLPLIAR
ncbi:MAG: DUF11 domain-containing protein [Caldilinea sp. CFX5]|nr:DUF11 domain-containing protein [Caldilinea sp. CFX5]